MKVHLGCGKRKIPGYVNVDIDPTVSPDMVLDLSKPLPWKEEIDVIYSCHNLEHYHRKDIPGILKNWFEALKPGGTLRLSVPNFQAIVDHWLFYQDLEKLYGLLHGGLKTPWDIHYISFDMKSLKKYLSEAGFTDIKKYDRWETEHADVDDYSAATLEPAFDKSGILMSLNVEARKLL